MAALALLASLIWGFVDFASGTASRRMHAVAVTGATHAVGLAVLLGWVAADGGLAGAAVWGPGALLGGVLSFVGIVMFYTAMSRGTMGVVAPIGATGAAVPVLFDLVRGEVPTGIQLVGLALAVVGCVLASGPELRRDEAAGGGGAVVITLAALAAVCCGVGFTLIAVGSAEHPAQTLAGMRLVSVVLAVGVGVAAWTTGGAGRADVALLIGIGVGDVAAVALYALATRAGSIGVAAVLSSLYPVVTVLLARRVHHERLTTVQLAGVVAALGGVVLIAAG